jgi:peptidoglycan/xylan/chitin deacetylase (PgdA/CDA1 family)
MSCSQSPRALAIISKPKQTQCAQPLVRRDLVRGLVGRFKGQEGLEASPKSSVLALTKGAKQLLSIVTGNVALTKAILRTGLEALYFSASHIWLRALVGGVGLILMFHHVRPARGVSFQPNRCFEVTPQFFEAAVNAIRGAGLEIVSLDEMHRRLTEQELRQRFACLTFDDGYRDNLTVAYPILKRHGVPFAVYVATSFPDRLGELWWLALEAIIAKQQRIGLVIDQEDRRFHCRTLEEKRNLFEALYTWLCDRPSEHEMRQTIRDLAARYDVDVRSLCQELCMSWAELAELASDPLCTIGAHSVSHSRLKKLSTDAAASEMRSSAIIIEAALGMHPRHFSYPGGDAASAGPREFGLANRLGFKTAVTTCPGVLFARHRDHLAALPRICLNGEYQQLRYLQVLLSGAGTIVWNNFGHGDPA